MTDRGLMDVAACCRLAELDVSGCTRIGECGDRALRALGKNCAELARLRMVGCNKVTDTGLGALAGGYRAMKEFAASNCGEVTDRALGVGGVTSGYRTSGNDRRRDERRRNK